MDNKSPDKPHSANVKNATPATGSEDETRWLDLLPELSAPPLDITELPLPPANVPKKKKVRNRWSVSFWTVGGHIALIGTGIFALAFTSSDLGGVWPLIAGLLAVAAYCYWQHYRVKISRLSDTIAQLNERAERLSDKAWELREGEERHRSLVEAFGDSVMHRSADDTITFANDSFANIFGNSAEAMIGTKFHPQSFGMDQNFPPLDQQGVVHEICIKLADGPRWYSWFDVPIRDANTGQAAIRSIVRDVTQHKETELALRQASQKAETASLAKTRFLANVSHEMRTPLNGILGMSNLLSDTKLSPDQNTYNEAIHTSGAALLTLIEDILDISRIEANNFEMRRDEINLAQLVENAAELLSVRAHAKNIGLSTYISNKIPNRIIVDGGQLRQVLINLVGNAVKFTDSGEVCLRVTPGLKKSSGKMASIRFEIEDTGPGISIADKQRIFEEFVQVDDENTRKHGGAGLGLAISQAIVREMDSEIAIESDGKSGTIFRFDLELEIESMDQDRAKPLIDRRIVIISEAKLEAASLARIVGDAGGLAALDGDAGLNPDCLLMDSATIKNPAHELARIKSFTPELTRAVILVAPEQRENLQTYLDNGFDAFLIKPVRGGSLLKILGDDPVGPEPLEELAETSKSSEASIRILLAEDNDINALLAKSILEKDGHEVIRVVNGQLAVAEFRQASVAGKPFDLVLMDLQMPIMDGLDAIKEISEFERDHQSVPVKKIILSADEQPQTLLEAEAAGADDYLTKPFNPARLIEIAREQAHKT